MSTQLSRVCDKTIKNDIKFFKDYYQSFSFDDIIAIEERDEQYIALKDARSSISKQNIITHHDCFVFVWRVVQNSLISFQLGGSGPQRWKEFGSYLIDNFGSISSHGLDNERRIERWKFFLSQCRFNKRIPSIKIKRIKKIGGFIDTISTIDDRYTDMKKFCDDLATHMEQPPTAKTICFTVKMMGYAARIVGSHFVAYPPSVSIPVDSRLTTIYNFFHPSDKQSNQRHIQQRFDHHAKHCGVPPLHFDSLIRCDFWQRYFLS